MNSDQLDLFEAELSRLPWRGQSPRALTKIGLGLFSRREPQKDDSFFIDPDQLELFPAAITRRGSLPAPLLLPLPPRAAF